MEQLRTLEHNSGAVSGSGFNPYQECFAVHPTNGEKCICRGAHAQHWAIYPGGNERTYFASWAGAPSFAPPVMTSGRVYPTWQKKLIMCTVKFLGAMIALMLSMWLVEWLCS